MLLFVGAVTISNHGKHALYSRLRSCLLQLFVLGIVIVIIIIIGFVILIVVLVTVVLILVLSLILLLSLLLLLMILLLLLALPLLLLLLILALSYLFVSKLPTKSEAVCNLLGYVLVVIDLSLFQNNHNLNRNNDTPRPVFVS